MALTSPGVEVTIIDQSQYLPAPTNSVPLVVLATAQNKADPTGTGVAAATTLANAGKLFQVTSQRDLVSLYGSPFFYTTSSGAPIQGSELNEYGLLAAYSLLGVTNRCYVIRADINLASLIGQTGRPVGFPEDGTYWLDTVSSGWGIYEFNAVTSKFTLQTPIVITDSTLLDVGVPLASLGNIGDYAVNAIQITTSPSDPNGKEYFYKTTANVWVPIGTGAWLNDWPTIQGTQSNATLVAGDTFSIGLSNDVSTIITVPAAPNNTVDGLVNTINSLGWAYLSASNRDGKLCLFSKQIEYGPTRFLEIANTDDSTVLNDLGILGTTYYQPMREYGTSSQQPLWSASQAVPRPTGSVWIKVGFTGGGLSPVISQFNAALASWVPKAVPLATSDWAISAALDSSGGATIAAGSIYAQYDFNTTYPGGPVYLWERITNGATVVTGTVENPAFSEGPYTASVRVSVPGSTELSNPYSIYLFDGATATGFVTAWSAAGIPFTTASITNTGAIQLIHTEGGEIVISDTITAGPDIGTSNGLLSTAGFSVGTTPGVKYGSSSNILYSNVAQIGTSGVGAALLVSINTSYQLYSLQFSNFSSPGSGYAVGDTVTFPGASLGGITGTNDVVAVVVSTDINGGVTGLTYVSGTPASAHYQVQLSNWRQFSYVANEGKPITAPINNTNWFYSVTDQVDIMVNYNGNWKGYKNQNYDSNGFPTPSGVNATDPMGPLVSPTEPTTQSDSTPLVFGDLWIDTTDLENYPVISRWQAVSGVNQWVLINNTDQINPTGVLFADSRWATSGTVNPADDLIPTIESLLTSNYLDIDAPASANFPIGMILFNTRRSGYNVKQFKTNYFSLTNFPGKALPVQTSAWVSASGLQSTGAPFMGRKAQRAMVVKSMRSAIDSNTDARDEDNFFNLIAAPNYPELQPNMVLLNSDRGETGYIIGDTPMGLSDNATTIQEWATNAKGATTTGEDGCVTRNTYMGLFYPSGITSDLAGNLVAVPASHMMLRTFLRNDTLSYPWLAAAGTRRGIIDNATNIGYLDRTTGEFQVIKTRVGVRDVLYQNFINPLVFFTGNGLLNYGNKTSFNSLSSLDRTNVARLLAYIRRQLTIAARPFVFEPNDALTRQQIAGVIETLLVDLVAKRGIYDYLVVCDESNNFASRIDRNQLWVDVAIEPVKAAEFIYVPVRILNTGELSAL